MLARKGTGDLWDYVKATLQSWLPYRDSERKITLGESIFKRQAVMQCSNARLNISLLVCVRRRPYQCLSSLVSS